MKDVQREKLEIDREEALNIIWEDSEEFELIEDGIDETSRWSEQHGVIVKRLSDGKFFSSYYSQGLTEQQDERPWDDEAPDFTEVFPKKITVTTYI